MQAAADFATRLTAGSPLPGAVSSNPFADFFSIRPEVVAAFSTKNSFPFCSPNHFPATCVPPTREPTIPAMNREQLIGRSAVWASNIQHSIHNILPAHKSFQNPIFTIFLANTLWSSLQQFLPGNVHPQFLPGNPFQPSLTAMNREQLVGNSESLWPTPKLHNLKLTFKLIPVNLFLHSLSNQNLHIPFQRHRILQHQNFYEILLNSSAIPESPTREQSLQEAKLMAALWGDQPSYQQSVFFLNATVPPNRHCSNPTARIPILLAPNSTREPTLLIFKFLINLLEGHLSQQPQYLTHQAFSFSVHQFPANKQFPGADFSNLAAAVFCTLNAADGVKSHILSAVFACRGGDASPLVHQ